MRLCRQSEIIWFGCSYSNADLFGHSRRNVTKLTRVFFCSSTKKVNDPLLQCGGEAAVTQVSNRENIMLMLTIPYNAYLPNWPACAPAQTVCVTPFSGI